MKNKHKQNIEQHKQKLKPWKKKQLKIKRDIDNHLNKSLNK